MTLSSSGSGTAERLDASLVAQTVPPGSMRYYAWLFTPDDKRDVLVALFLLDDELRSTARSDHHDVAHTRLNWWHEEIDRLARGIPVHPATRVLGNGLRMLDVEPGRLRALIEAAAMDLARITYTDDTELEGYLERSGGVTAEFVARWLLVPQHAQAATLQVATRIGALLRRVETLRDLRVDTTAGRIYFPLTMLEHAGIELPDLRAAILSSRTRDFLQSILEKLRKELADANDSIPAADRAALRPLLVLAGLHLRLLDRIARDFASHAPQRVELAPFEKLWCAWRWARRAR